MRRNRCRKRMNIIYDKVNSNSELNSSCRSQVAAFVNDSRFKIDLSWRQSRSVSRWKRVACRPTLRNTTDMLSMGLSHFLSSVPVIIYTLFCLFTCTGKHRNSTHLSTWTNASCGRQLCQIYTLHSIQKKCDSETFCNNSRKPVPIEIKLYRRKDAIPNNIVRFHKKIHLDFTEMSNF